MGEGQDYRRSNKELLSSKEEIQRVKKDEILVSTYLKWCHIEGLNLLMVPRIRVRTKKGKSGKDVEHSFLSQCKTTVCLSLNMINFFPLGLVSLL